MSFYHKYLKYKNKYLTLMTIQSGGAAAGASADDAFVVPFKLKTQSDVDLYFLLTSKRLVSERISGVNMSDVDMVTLVNSLLDIELAKNELDIELAKDALENLNPEGLKDALKNVIRKVEEKGRKIDSNALIEFHRIKLANPKPRSRFR